MSPQSLYQLLTVLGSIAMVAVFIGCPAILIIFGKMYEEEKGKRIALVVFLVSAVMIAGAMIGTRRLGNSQNTANTQVVLADARVKQALSSRWDLRTDTGLYAKEPYITLCLDKTKKPVSIGDISSKSNYETLTEADVASMKTICFAVEDEPETAKYVDEYGNSKGTGTSEQRICWLYDVDSGTFFLRERLGYRLPNKWSGETPKMQVRESDYHDFVRKHLAPAP